MTTLTFSQGIVSHSTDTGLPGGNANFLVIDGDKVNLHAPLDQSLVTVFAHRDTNYLLTLQQNSDISAWGYGSISDENAVFDNINGGGSAANEYYLWIELDRITGSVSYGHSIWEPATGSTPPLTNATRPDGQHWFDTTENVMKIWTVTGVTGRWSEVIRLFVAKYIFSANFSSMSINAPAYVGTTTGIVGQNRAGALIYDVVGKAVLRTDASNNTTFFTTEDVFTSGLPALASPVSGNRARYETFLVDALGAASAPAFSIVRFTDFNEVVLMDAGLQENSLWGLIEFPVGASGDLVQVTMSGQVRNPTWNWSTVGQQIYVDKDNDGILTTVEDGYVPLPNQLPVGVALEATSMIIRRPELAFSNSGGGGVTDHGALTSIGVNTHSQIDLHIADTSIHQALTVSDINGSPTTTVADVNRINFNNLSGFDVIDQTGGVVQIDLNSSFNPLSISASGGSTGGDATMTASGEEEFRFIAGANVTLIGDNTGPPKSLLIAAVDTTDHMSLTNIGTNTHVDIDNHISNVSNPHGTTLLNLTDTTVGTVAKGDILVYSGTAWEDLTVGANGTVLTANSAQPFGVEWVAATGGGGSPTPLFNVVEDLLPQLGGNLDINGNSIVSLAGIEIDISAGAGSGGNGGRVDINAGAGDTTTNGGNVTIDAGSGGATSGTGGVINLTAGGSNGASTPGSITLVSGFASGTAVGGAISLQGGFGSNNDGGAINIAGAAAGGSNTGGNVNITAGQNQNTSGSGGNVSLAPGQGDTASDDGHVAIARTNGAGANRPSVLRFNEGDSGSNFVGFQAAQTLTGDVTWTLPTSDSTGTQALVSDGAGTLSWSAVGGTSDTSRVRVASAAQLSVIGWFAGAGPNGRDVFAGVNWTTHPGTDQVTLVLGDLILVKDEPTATRNGIYEVTNVGTNEIERVLDMSTTVDQGRHVYVAEGTVNTGTNWVLTGAPGTKTVNTHTLDWTSVAAVPAGTAFKYTETGAFTASVPKSITHNLGEKFVTVQVYDSNDDQIGVQLINLVDNNNIQVTLNASLAGVTVVVVG